MKISYEKAKELLQEFDYEKNSLEDTIFFLQLILDNLKDEFIKKKVGK